MTTPRKAPDAFRTIGEVADWLGVETHVLRFWESKFADVKPVKRAGGRRYYRPEDMALLGGLKQLLHEDGMTIRGAQKVLAEKGPGHVRGRSKPLAEAVDGQTAGGAGSDRKEPAQHALPLDDPAAAPARGLNGTGAAHRHARETGATDTAPEAPPRTASDADPDAAPEAAPEAAPDSGGVAASADAPEPRPDDAPPAPDAGETAPPPGDMTGGERSDDAPPEAPPGPADRPAPREIPRAEIARVLERARALRRRMEEGP